MFVRQSSVHNKVGAHPPNLSHLFAHIGSHYFQSCHSSTLSCKNFWHGWKFRRKQLLSYCSSQPNSDGPLDKHSTLPPKKGKELLLAGQSWQTARQAARQMETLSSSSKPWALSPTPILYPRVALVPVIGRNCAVVLPLLDLSLAAFRGKCFPKIFPKRLFDEGFVKTAEL